VSSRGIEAIVEERTTVELQHLNVKLLLENSQDLDLDAIVHVFHGWIQEQLCEELLLDVADYRHVHHGPGVVLIGHEADYAIDNTDGRWGIRYNRKASVAGSNQDRLIQSARAALLEAQRLQQDTSLNGKYNFNGREIELIVNDRLLAPNTPETRQLLEAEIHSFAQTLFGSAEYTLAFETDPRKLSGVRIQAEQRIATDILLENLNVSRSPNYDVL
jgi:hypothetical protein